MLNNITDRKEEIIEAAEVLIKYQGYIDRERMIADKIHRLEAIRIKGKFDYNSLNSLSTEARQKLIKIDLKHWRKPAASREFAQRYQCSAGASRKIKGNVSRETSYLIIKQ
mgnify:CR=1 FL=1